MPERTARDAALALGTVSVTKGGIPRVRRRGQREWEDAPVGTKVYGGDRIRMERGEGSIRHRDGGFVTLREGSLTEMIAPRPKGKRKRREIQSGEANFGSE